jgi:hypothetical protein
MVVAVWRTPTHRSVETSHGDAVEGRRTGRVPSGRQARALVRQLRRVARSRPDRDPLRRRYVPYQHDRVDAVRSELLELAALLEQAHDIDPETLADVRRLVTSGCDSPLYNPVVHPSELLAALYFLRSRLREASASPPRIGHGG